MNVFKKILERMNETKELYARLQIGTNRNSEIITYIGKEQAIDNAISIVKEAEYEYNNGWIPCNERLPKYDEEYFEKHNNNRQYIVMCKDSYAPTVAYFSKEKTWYYNDFVKFNDVIAWQPLPEPYKECEKE